MPASPEQFDEMKPIIIIGSSGHSKVVIDAVESEGKHQIIGLIDRFRKVGEDTLGYKILGGENDIPRLTTKPGLFGAIVAIGDNHIRAKVTTRLFDLWPEVNLVTVIHPSAVVGRMVEIGAGTVILAGAIVNACSKIGSGCILNTNSSLGHDCFIDDFSSLAPRVAIGGNCKIGRGSAISIGATLIHRVVIGDNTIIGAGATVTNPIPNDVVAYGTPARFIRHRKAGDKYL